MREILNYFKKIDFTLVALGTSLVVFLVIGFITLSSRREEPRFEAGIGGGPPLSPLPLSVTTIQRRETLHKLLAEHVSLTAVHLDNLYDSKDVSMSKSELDSNSKQIVDFLIQISGNISKEDQATLTNLWSGHISEYEAYTLALKDKNMAVAEKIKDSLIMHSKDFGILINRILKDVSVDDATDQMREHGSLTLLTIEAHAKGDNNLEVTQAARASMQTSRFTEVLIPE